MTTEEIEKAANEFAEKHGFRVPYDGSNEFYDKVDVRASKDGFKAGAEFVDKHWQEKTRWIPIKERRPEVRDTLYCIAVKWEDFMYQEERAGLMYIYTEEDIDYISVACKCWKEIE